MPDSDIIPLPPRLRAVPEPRAADPVPDFLTPHIDEICHRVRHIRRTYGDQAARNALDVARHVLNETGGDAA